MEFQNDRFLCALKRQPVDRTPVWMMRQAGRYLPEYRATRAKAGDFLTLCKTPELACEVTLQPLARFPLDAAIIFSDILTIPDAMDLGLHFLENEGPRFSRPIRNARDIDAIPILDPEDKLKYVLDALRVTSQALNKKVPLIGFSGSPWTLATYMVEGGSSKQFARIKALRYQEPLQAHKLLKKLADNVILYLKAQIRAGASALMIFDTWGGVLSQPDYLEFSLQYMDEIVAALKDEAVPVIIFTKNSGLCLEQIAKTGCAGIGLDWTCNLTEARKKVGHRVALQGNLDPCVLYASPQDIQANVAKVLADFGPGSGHIFNLGHGVHQDVHPEQVACLIEAVQTLSPVYHARQVDYA